jgi:hypothetical protein
MEGDTLGLLTGALRLRAETFAALQLRPDGLQLALWIVLLAGLSSALGQSVVLFVNEVRPRRWISSLVVSALLFVLSFLFWVGSIWLVAGQVFDHERPFMDAVRSVGLAHTPQLFGFFVLTPYFGGAIANALSIWVLLATLVATSVVFGVSLPVAVACTALGWLLLFVAQRTVGRPLIWLARRIRRAVAGSDLDPYRPQNAPSDGGER